MQPLELIAGEEFSRLYRLADGRVIRITIEQDPCEIQVHTASDERIGALEFEECDDGGLYLLKMFLHSQDGKYLHCGIGRQALLFIKELWDPRITAADHDGIPRDDGSHLTGSGAPFVARMRSEGLIEQSSYCCRDDLDD